MSSLFWTIFTTETLALHTFSLWPYFLQGLYRSLREGEENVSILSIKLQFDGAEHISLELNLIS